MGKSGCKSIINAVREYAGKEYIAFRKIEDPSKSKAMEELYTNCKNEMINFSSLVDYLGQKNDLVSSVHKNILDGTRRRIRPYYWGELQMAKSLESPESISVFCEKILTTGEVRFRVSLEIDENRATNSDIENHNRKILGFENIGDFHYVLNAGKAREMYFTDDRDDAKRKMDLKEYSKIQICKTILEDASSTDEDYLAQLLDAVKEANKFYKQILA